ncbi:unnamed protein product [Schistocephalus solidus]|uniref:Uncharacterized protein n=1 Tax=Schistocephalus solidus TaxID=70667 RepID=A0A3P7D7H0_SCHSO|nr:unnamed protein product [Schistocephalus solidus]
MCVEEGKLIIDLFFNSKLDVGKDGVQKCLGRLHFALFDDDESVISVSAPEFQGEELKNSQSSLYKTASAISPDRGEPIGTTIRASLMWEWAYWLTGRRTRLRAPQHDLSPVTHTPGFTKAGDMEEPSPSDSKSTGQPLDTHRIHWADGVVCLSFLFVDDKSAMGTPDAPDPVA